ncbi:GFA family protein [Marinobacter xestospongiae]|uniref:GFA family protein n=1 Tax=Marinobacter xestospongiae TaxID=994319 RepID=UPI0020037CB2|nr:GFA family protein [Marinobacter xestospongiae]MCK7567268.1 GFA family protein [Marinobacter xestospongiae]
MLTGQCLCGAIKYQYDGPVGPVSLCHCQRCRRAQGGAFSASAPLQAVRFQFTEGEDQVREFESLPGKYRAFCPSCGSPLYSRVDAIPGIVRLRVGTLDGDLGKGPASHIYVGSKSDWFQITDDLPQYDKTERTNDPH